uniref:DUF1725 domain-containing protein n=1 Tax=Phocoena sinus TaxID=42100 RepID=A0A8C9BUU9_PHOSS
MTHSLTKYELRSFSEPNQKIGTRGYRDNTVTAPGLRVREKQPNDCHTMCFCLIILSLKIFGNNTSQMMLVLHTVSHQETHNVRRNQIIAALFTIARTWKQPKCPSTDEWIKKMWHIHTMDYYSDITRYEIELFVMRWMDLETVIQSKVSQKEKNKYRMLTHIYGI